MLPYRMQVMPTFGLWQSPTGQMTQPKVVATETAQAAVDALRAKTNPKLRF